MGSKTPEEIVRAAEAAGAAKGAMSARKLLISGFLAGAYIAFGGLLAEAVCGGMPGVRAANPGLVKLVFAAVFPVGLMLVVVAGAELFTGNTAVLIPAVRAKATSRWRLGRNWVGSFVGNFIGAVFVALVLVKWTGLLSAEPWAEAAREIARGKVNQGFWVLFWKGVGCNWLVCLAVWMAMAAEDVAGKILAVWWPIMAFVAIGFEHSVANMFFVPAGIFLGAKVTWGQFLADNLLAVTLGNIVGGAVFVGGLYGRLYGRRRS